MTFSQNKVVSKVMDLKVITTLCGMHLQKERNITATAVLPLRR